MFLNRTRLIVSRQSEEDILYEQDIQRNPGSTRPWLAYIEYKQRHGALQEQAFVMERACTQLPRSYKLWKMVRRGALRQRRWADTMGRYTDSGISTYGSA